MAILIKRSLYQCANAKVKRERMYCAKGMGLGRSVDGTLSILKLQRGEPLVFEICQECRHYDDMGPPLMKDERGW